MRIEKLTIKNFRGIRDMEIKFSEKINVFVGVNGSGKSSILDLLTILLSGMTGQVTRKIGKTYTEKDITNGESHTISEVDFKHDSHRYSSRAWKYRDKKKSFKNSSDSPDTALFRKYLISILEKNPNANIPLCIYYSVNRSVFDPPLRIKTRHSFSQIDAYDQALTGKRNDFRLFFEWFREREDFENEMIRDKENCVDTQLDAVRQSITAFTGFKGVRIRRKPLLRMELSKDGKIVYVDQLSDGEKCLLALIGDLARWLAIANPSLEYPLQGEGVVLMDEIELHLHPSWQRMVIPKLSEIFPNCQFIITTHSPQVISHVKPESIFLLYPGENGIEYKKPSESYGKNSDSILEDLMGVDARPSDVKKDLDSLYLMIDKGHLDKAKKKILAIKKNIGDDAELTKADVLIRRKEIIGK